MVEASISTFEAEFVAAVVDSVSAQIRHITTHTMTAKYNHLRASILELAKTFLSQLLAGRGPPLADWHALYIALWSQEDCPNKEKYRRLIDEAELTQIELMGLAMSIHIMVKWCRTKKKFTDGIDSEPTPFGFAISKIVGQEQPADGNSVCRLLGR